MERERREISWSAVAVVAAAVAVTVACGYLLATWPPEPPQAPRALQRPAAAATPSGSPSPTASTSPVAAQQPVLAVLGDSFTAQSQASPGEEWPQLVGGALKWQVFSEASDGSGYLSPGTGGSFRQDVSGLLRHRPDVVVVAGGYSDVRSFGVPEITQAADRLVSRLVAKAPDAKVVVVSPFSNGAPGPLTVQLSTALRQVAQNHGAAYVDATGWLTPGSGLVAADGVHPTDQGQQRIASRMEQALKRLDVGEAAGQPAG